VFGISTGGTYLVYQAHDAGELPIHNVLITWIVIEKGQHASKAECLFGIEAI